MRNTRGKHQSVDEMIRPQIEWLESLPEVQRVIPGRIESCKHSYRPGTLRVRNDEHNGFRVNAYMGGAIRDVVVVISPLEARDKIKCMITERFEDFKSFRSKGGR